MNEFHFLRPWCFLLLLLVLPVLRDFSLRQSTSHAWRKYIDPALLPHVLSSSLSTSRQHWLTAALVLFSLLITLALAGPSWRKVEQPVLRTVDSLVLVLDLSQSMNAADVKPSRLERAKYKILDILEKRKQGQTALIVYAASPFTVSPLTPDTKTIGMQVKAMDSSLMPFQGSSVDLAVKKAVNLMRQAGVEQGDILLVTDGIGEADKDKVVEQAGNSRISVLGIGTLDGAPIPHAHQGFVYDQDNNMVLAGLDETELHDLAKETGGRYARLRSDNQDLDYLLAPLAAGKERQESSEQQSFQYLDEGFWLIPFLFPFVLLFFRKGVLFFFLFTLLTVSPVAEAGEWKSLWQNKNQQGQAAIRENRPGEAAKLFIDPDWQAAAHYQAKEYEQALEALPGENGNHYNRGNILASMGKYEQALAEYEQAIAKKADDEDAVYNRDLIKKIIEEQEQQQQQEEEQNQEQQEQNQEQQESQQGQEQQEGEQQEQQEGEQQSDSQEQQQRESPRQDENKDADNPQQSQQQEEVKQQQAQEKDEQEPPAEEAEEKMMQTEEQQQAEEQQQQWLRDIPDDPGGLWRRKFQYQYQQTPEELRRKPKPW